ncbi:MAG: porin [Methylotenera sp.]|nr:porin [Methylotenera sp.]
MNYKLHSLVAATLAGSFMFGFGANAMADSTDDIVNALIAKGVLTEEEGSLLTKGRAGEKEAAANKAKGAVTAKYKDGIVIGTEDGKNSIQINGRLHADYRSFDYSKSDNGSNAVSATGADTFDIRRARIGAKVKFLDHYSGEVVFNGTGSAPVLDVAYLDIAWWKPATIRVGQFKMPYSLEQLTSSNNIDFVERSFVDAYIPAKETGAMLHGSPFKGVTYGLAASTGRGQNGIEDDVRVDGVDVIGRATVNLAEIMDNKDMVLHGGLAFSEGDISKSTGLGGNRSTEAKGASFFTAPVVASTNLVDASIDRSRFGLETALAYGPFKVQGQYSKTNFDFETATRGYDVDVKTYYVQALWTITGESHADRYKNGAFGGLKPKNNFDPAKLSGGAWEVGVRYSSFDGSDFDTLGLNSVAPLDGQVTTKASKYTEADAWTFGVKFVANPHVRFMLDYVKTDFNNPIGTSVVTVNGKEEDSEKAILFRTQFAF